MMFSRRIWEIGEGMSGFGRIGEWADFGESGSDERIWAVLGNGRISGMGMSGFGRIGEGMSGFGRTSRTKGALAK